MKVNLPTPVLHRDSWSKHQGAMSRARMLEQPNEINSNFTLTEALFVEERRAMVVEDVTKTIYLVVVGVSCELKALGQRSREQAFSHLLSRVDVLDRRARHHDVYSFANDLEVGQYQVNGREERGVHPERSSLVPRRPKYSSEAWVAPLREEDGGAVSREPYADVQPSSRHPCSSLYHICDRLRFI